MHDDVSRHLAATWARATSIVEDAVVAVGLQLWVAQHGKVVANVALGECATGPMTVDTMHNSFCLGKPILSLAALALVDDGLATLDEPLGVHAVGQRHPACRDLTMRDLLEHHAGLDAPSAIDYRMTPAVDHDALFAAGIDRAERRPAYSEIASGIVLERLIADATGEPAVDYIHRRVLEPLGLGRDDIAVDADDARRAVGAGRASVAIGGLPVRRTPMTSTLLVGQLAGIRPAFDVLWAARSAGRLMDAVGRSLAGETIPRFIRPAVLLDACTPRNPPFEDRWTKRTMRFAGGFWADLPGTGFASRPSSRAIAAVAGVVNAFVVTDPDAVITVAVFLNGASLDSEFAALERRALCDAVFNDLGVGRP